MKIAFCGLVRTLINSLARRKSVKFCTCYPRQGIQLVEEFVYDYPPALKRFFTQEELDSFSKKREVVMFKIPYCTKCGLPLRPNCLPVIPRKPVDNTPDGPSD